MLLESCLEFCKNAWGPWPLGVIVVGWFFLGSACAVERLLCAKFAGSHPCNLSLGCLWGKHTALRFRID